MTQHAYDILHYILHMVFLAIGIGIGFVAARLKDAPPEKPPER